MNVADSNRITRPRARWRFATSLFAVLSTITGLALLAEPQALLAGIDGEFKINLPIVGNGGATATPGPQSPTPTPSVPVNAKRWSDPATWGGSVPAQNAAVTIPAGTTVLLDVSPPALSSLMIHGALLFDDQDRALTAGYIMVHAGGRLQIGAPGRPYRARATITLNAQDRNASVMGMGTRGLLVMGGAFEIHASPPVTPWTQLGANAASGAQSIRLKAPADWRASDELVIAPTSFYGFGETQRYTISASSGALVTLTQPLRQSHWGALQYVTANGVSLDPAQRLTNSATPTIIDQRAEVANLTRNVVIQGADDALWRDHGFGAHIMVMDRASRVVLNGVGLRRVGQSGIVGRYPLHFHLLSYSASGAELGDASVTVSNSVISDSSQRCLVLHATNGARVQNNICYDIKGHAFFLEDAVERRNVLEGNLALKMRFPAQPLQSHEREVFQGGPSGFWLTNPDNIVRGNAAADARGNGFWMSFPRAPLGASKSVALRPDRMPFGLFDDNTAHSNGEPGINLDWIVINDAGDVTTNKYIPTVDGVDVGYDYTKWLRFSLRRINVFKNNGGGLWNRVSWPDYESWVSTDNGGVFFAGAGDDGKIKRSLLVGKTLNDDGNYPAHTAPPSGAATYHSTFDIADNLFVNFAFVDGESSGAFRTNDYYIRPVDKGLVRNTGNRLIASNPGYRTRPITVENWTLAGALWDANGYWGPSGNYWVYDEPFFTTGATCQQVEPAGKNGVSCNGPYYGVLGYVLNRSPERYMPLMAIQAVRQDNAGGTIGMWSVGEGVRGGKLQNMRHFAALKDGRYVLSFPGFGAPNDAMFVLENMHTVTDTFLLAISYDGARNAGVYMTTQYNYEAAQTQPDGPYKRTFTQVNSLADVRAACNTYWQDSAANLVWMRLCGGMAMQGEANFKPNSDSALYRETFVRVYAR